MWPIRKPGPSAHSAHELAGLIPQSVTVEMCFGTDIFVGFFSWHGALKKKHLWNKYHGTRVSPNLPFSATVSFLTYIHTHTWLGWPSWRHCRSSWWVGSMWGCWGPCTGGRSPDTPRARSSPLTCCMSSGSVWRHPPGRSPDTCGSLLTIRERFDSNKLNSKLNASLTRMRSWDCTSEHCE